MLRVEAVLGRIEPHAPSEVGELLAAFVAEVNRLEGRALERFLESEARRYEWPVDPTQSRTATAHVVMAHAVMAYVIVAHTVMAYV